MKVLGIDPGYAIVGYGLVGYKNNKFVSLGYGAITTPAEMDFDERLKRIYDETTILLKKANPDAVAIERLYFTTNQKTAIDVAQARGVTLLCIAQAGIPMYEYTPLQVKQSVVGYGKAEKKQVMEMTRIMLNLDNIPRPDDAADALAIAICHAHSAGSSLGLLERLAKENKL